LEVPTLFILGSETQGSALPEPERATVANALPHGKVKVFDTGHSVHSEDSESYLRLLGTWLESPGRYRSAG
jgi:hypothetical protein